jgi:hypothetical protein
MGCLTVQLKCLNTTPYVEAESRERIITNVKNIRDPFIVETINKSTIPKVTMENLLEGLKVMLSIVGSITELGKYLEVSPEEIQWITDDTGIYYDVYSNVNWIITNI